MSHSRYSPSSRRRWRACPGSVKLIEALDLPESDSVYASDGTEAHALAAACLNNGADPTDPAVATYVGYIRQMSGVVFVEQQLKDPENPDIYGTPDCVVFDFGGRLTIVDYKHGAGVGVDPEDNPQLQMYSVLAAANGMGDVAEVALVIVQPNYDGEPIKQEVYTPVAIGLWRDQILAEIDVCETSGAPLVSGQHCQFCDAKPHCPELKANTQLAMGLKSTMPAPEQLRPDQLAWLLQNERLITQYLKSVWSFATSQAMSGNPPPGWKLVRGQGNRKWADPKLAQKGLRDLGLKLDQVAPREMLSPAQAEAALKSAGKPVDWVALMTTRPETAPRLVRENATGELYNALSVFKEEPDASS